MLCWTHVLGYSLIFLPFLAIVVYAFLAMVEEEGLKCALFIYGFVVGLFALIGLATYLIHLPC